jgi:hypothetical protein
MKFATVSVDAYMINGKLYESKPIMTPAGESAGYAFMEFLSERSGYRLYRYCSNCGKFDPATGQIAPENFRYCYYLYKDSIMCHMFCTSRAKALLKYFGVSVFI